MVAFHFFSDFRDFLLILTQTIIKNMFWLFLETKKLSPVARARIKKIFRHVFTQIEISIDVFFTFFVLQRLVFRFCLWTLIGAYFSCTKKNFYLQWREHANFEKKIVCHLLPKSRFETLVFHVFHTSET